MTPQQLLLKLMNLDRFAGLVRTADGYYIAQAHGELGYNHFLGRPAPVHFGPGLSRTLDTWANMSHAERLAVWRLARTPLDGSPIPLDRDFGVPVIAAAA